MSSNSSILCLSFISNISNISIIVICVVFHMLNTTIRKVDRVGTIHNSSTIIGLCLVKCSTRIVISHSIIVSVGSGFSKVRLGISTNCMSNNRGMVDKGSMSNGIWMSHCNWVSYSMTHKTMSKERVSSRCCGNNCSNTNKGLHVLAWCSLT